jgi:hypothetical protein
MNELTQSIMALVYAVDKIIHKNELNKISNEDYEKQSKLSAQERYNQNVIKMNNYMCR